MKKKAAIKGTASGIAVGLLGDPFAVGRGFIAFALDTETLLQVVRLIAIAHCCDKVQESVRLAQDILSRKNNSTDDIVKALDYIIDARIYRNSLYILGQGEIERFLQENSGPWYKRLVKNIAEVAVTVGKTMIGSSLSQLKKVPAYLPKRGNREFIKQTKILQGIQNRMIDFMNINKTFNPLFSTVPTTDIAMNIITNAFPDIENEINSDETTNQLYQIRERLLLMDN